jgi:hypothetical protein
MKTITNMRQCPKGLTRPQRKVVSSILSRVRFKKGRGVVVHYYHRTREVLARPLF